MEKLLAEMIVQRLQSHMDGKNSFLENQLSFRKGRSTMDAIQAVVDIATKARRETGKRKGFCALISIDIRNAFNTARWKNCIETMMRKKVLDYLLCMMDDYLSNRWVVYMGDKWSLKEEMTYDLLERASSASRMTHLSCAPRKTSESWSWGSMSVCGGQSGGCIAEAWEWPLKRPRHTERCGAKNSISTPNCVDECCAGPGEEQSIDLLVKNRQETFQFYKEITCTTNKQVIAPTKEVRMEDTNSSEHDCFNAYLKRFMGKKDESCRYCGFHVDDVEHTFFVCIKWGVAWETVGRALNA